jgi:site-specific recombinase XerD
MRESVTKATKTPSVDFGKEELCQSFLLDLAIRPESKETYRRELKRFFLFGYDYKIVNPTREDVLSYKSHLENQSLAALTLGNYLVVVRKFFEWLEGRKLYPNIAKGVKGTKKPKGFRKDTLTVEQVKGVLSSIDRTTLPGQRDSSILSLLIRTGLRTIEVVRANVGDSPEKAESKIKAWLEKQKK